MLERDYKMMALSLATQLPEDEATARKVLAYLSELVDGWIFSDSPNQSFSLPGRVSESFISSDKRLIDKPEETPR